jgi:hypothetical protein
VIQSDETDLHSVPEYLKKLLSLDSEPVDLLYNHKGGISSIPRQPGDCLFFITEGLSVTYRAPEICFVSSYFLVSLMSSCV